MTAEKQLSRANSGGSGLEVSHLSQSSLHVTSLFNYLLQSILDSSYRVLGSSQTARIIAADCLVQDAVLVKPVCEPISEGWTIVRSQKFWKTEQIKPFC